MTKWYYVVSKGIEPGVYENWEDNDEWCCLNEWCCHKKFKTLQEATAKFEELLSRRVCRRLTPSLSFSPSPLKRPSTEPTCCDRPDMPFCQRRPGFRHVAKCQLCGSALNDAVNPICGMSGVPHSLPDVLGPGARGQELAKADTDKEKESETK